MELHVSHKAECYGSISSGIIAFDQPRSSGIIPFEKPRFDYDVPYKIKEPLKSAHWLHLFEGVEQLFPGGVQQIRCDIQKYHAASGYEFKIYRNEKLRIGACCANKKEEKCNWHLYVVSVDGVVGSPFIIKELDNHHACFKREYDFDISRYYAYSGKKHALNTTWGENEKSFMFLNWYKNKLIETNHGSHVVLEVEEGTQKFQRMFICFEACSRRFNFCRPVLFVDVDHLKSKYLGHMMAAKGLTGNDEIYPLAYVVVSSENEPKWKWFLENLKEVLSPLRLKLTFVSDQGIGLVTQIPVVFPEAFHPWCYWHMECNINTFLAKNCKVYNKYVLGLFKKCAYASTHKEFAENWEKLRKVENHKFQGYLSRAPVDKWESFFFKGRRYGRLCSNIAESFNGSVVEERENPIAIMVDEIRVKLMDQMCKRREDSSNLMNWRQTLCPEYEALLHDNKMHGYPYKYVEHYFTVKFYRESYKHAINPVPTVEKPVTVSSKSMVFGQNNGPRPARPSKKKRIPNTASVLNKKMRTCGSCKVLTTHNKRTCPSRQIP
ncbi:uncharacterized protein LOC113273037 [Papaver somniferum]|uniref:uncharacterized protein LOC113273037 n=1 Tax=Papaver somniferum TaxID=3469 RepID=UPI000E6FB3C2|nr:uncharacterized protein LOC113273037 [Papaver somniferum]